MGRSVLGSDFVPRREQSNSRDHAATICVVMRRRGGSRFDLAGGNTTCQRFGLSKEHEVLQVPRPTLLVAEPEPLQALSVRKLVLETGKFNVLTAHSTRESIDIFHMFPNISGAVLGGMFYYFIEYHRGKLNTLASTLSSCVSGYAFVIPHFCDGK